MKKTRLIVLMLFMLLCIGVESNIAYAKDGATLKASSTVTENDKAVVNIDLNGNTGIWALKFKVGYDHSALKLESTQNGEVFSNNDVTRPDSLDKEEYVFLASSNSIKNIEKSGTVLILNFETVQYALEGEYPIKVTLVQAIDAKGNTINIDTKDGEVTVFYEITDKDLVFDKSKNESIKIPTEREGKIKKVAINDNKIDKNNYTIDPDGNIEISQNYLNTLKDGKYKVTVVKGKKTKTTEFIVKTDATKKVVDKYKEGEKTKENKKTSINGAKRKDGIVIAVAVMVVAIIAGIAFVLVRRRREKQ